MAQAQEQILTTGEAATLCGVSRSTLRRAVAQGHLQAWHTPGKHLRFTRSACLDFARSLGRIDLVGQPYSREHDRETSLSGVRHASGAAYSAR
ncbi:MAG: excisionase family DNA-binding protein [Candidatus Dormibacteria bacterium]